MMPAPARVSTVLCLGAACVDRVGTTSEAAARLSTSNMGSMRTAFGGAARNVAEGLARLGVPARLTSIVGEDADGAAVLSATASAGVDIAGCVTAPGRRTASYTAVFDGRGELVIGLADMGILSALPEAAIEAAVAQWSPDLALFVDANLDPGALQSVAAAKRGLLAAGPVSVQKSRRIAAILDRIDLLFLNRYEAESILGEAATLAELAARLVGKGVARGILTAGPAGGLAWAGEARLALPAPSAQAVNVNGAGDALAAATLARLHAGDTFFAAAERGMAAAALTVETEATVRQDLTMALLMDRPAGPITEERP